MKHMFIKSLLFASAAMIAWNCTDDTSTSTPENSGLFIVNENVWWINAGNNQYLIHPLNVQTGMWNVTDAFSNVIGIYDPATGAIFGLDGQVIMTAPELSTLNIITPQKQILSPEGAVIGDIYGNVYPQSSGSIPTSQANPIGGTSSAAITSAATSASSSADIAKPASSSVQKQDPTPASSSQKSQTPASSSSKKSDGGKIGNLTYTGSLEQDVANEGTIQTIVISNVQSDPTGSRDWKLYFLDMKYDGNAKTLTVSGKVSADQKDKSLSETLKIDGNDVKFTLNIGSAAKGNTSEEKKSSSSVKTEEKSSSSKVQQSVELKYVNGGASGDGWATRYWDCCKPSCAWNENAGGNPTRTCTLQGGQVGPGDQSVCSGGPAAVCMSQIPVVVNDNLAYAFAAVPASNGGQCGKCFALEFTGEGKYESAAPHKALKGKILVVQVSNIGGDVNQGQFDVMIPGGGVGAFNGCSSVWGNNLGAQYGGLLSECEESVGYKGDLLKKRQECLTEKCNSVFANHKEAKEGCLFLATWMQAAGNPKHKYREVECPADLKAKW